MNCFWWITSWLCVVMAVSVSSSRTLHMLVSRRSVMAPTYFGSMVMARINKARYLSTSALAEEARPVVTELSEGDQSRYKRKGYQPFWQFAKSRDWQAVSSFWASMLVNDEAMLSTFVRGEAPYTLTPIMPLHAAGLRGEFQSKDSRYLKRHNYAMRLGYDGIHYFGYQRQRHQSIATVEGDLFDILGLACFAAGRTDRGVHALSQVVNFATGNPNLTAEHFTCLLQQSEACRQHRLRVFELYRVPKRFHARTCAKWRRYLFLFPLARTTQDLGELFRYPQDIHLQPDDRYHIDINRLNTILGRLKNEKLYYTAMSYQESNNSNASATAKDICTLFEARAFEVDLPQSANKAICVELVGTRFLRQMVRILVATALRHSWSCPDLQTPPLTNDNVLLDILQSQDRNQAELPLAPQGLCFAGVGYDPVEMSIYQFMPQAQLAALQKEFGLIPTQ